MKKANWIWMPHAGHLIVGNECQFHLNTYVGKYIVSTVGEYWPDRMIREIHAKIWNKEWYEANKNLKGDTFDFEYHKAFGFLPIGAGPNSTYETMVFGAKKSKNKCCPYVISVGRVKDSKRYGNADDAMEGHMKLCEKWSKK